MSYSNLGKGLGLVLATLLVGVAKNAGFKCVAGTAQNDENGNPNTPGASQFLTAMHVISANSDVGFPMFTDSTTLKSIGSTAPASTTMGSEDTDLRETTGDGQDDMLHICRAMLLNTSGSYFQLKNSAEDFKSSCA